LTRTYFLVVSKISCYVGHEEAHIKIKYFASTSAAAVTS